jgi:hypothetical protein
MSSSRPLDIFDRARSVSASILFACGLAAILGALLDWVTVEPPQVVPPNQTSLLDPFSGIEATDGWFVIAAGAVVILSAAMLVLKATSGYAWIAFFASMVVGGIALADYRGLEDLFYREMDRIGDPEPAIGLSLVAVAGIIGVIAAAAGVAASPRRAD